MMYRLKNYEPNKNEFVRHGRSIIENNLSNDISVITDEHGESDKTVYMQHEKLREAYWYKKLLAT